MNHRTLASWTLISDTSLVGVVGVVEVGEDRICRIPSSALNPLSFWRVILSIKKTRNLLEKNVKFEASVGEIPPWRTRILPLKIDGKMHRQLLLA
ncbi:hypothetical protein VIGAN_01374200 [Vigna angularis var. angularis]|uniref:Uncharacterized protein n=1 Tax=Vigna angularis var. angularis TaxID=157739 RepID=A0A0S3R5E6_PHAAN|nr:hypothetical protein VIGAN_01374200 [Vigna angularis var. angularis]